MSSPTTAPEIILFPPFRGSSDPRITDALRVRFEVFITEQSCDPAHERDSADDTSYHWVAYTPSSSSSSSSSTLDPSSSTFAQANSLIPIATARLVLPPFDLSPPGGGPSIHAPKGYLKIGRMAVRKPWRKMGVAAKIVDAICEFAGNEIGRDVWDGRMLAQAQVGALEAWRRMGFLEGGDWVGREGGEGCVEMGEWLDERIPHRAAWRRVEVLKSVTEKETKDITESGEVHKEGHGA